MVTMKNRGSITIYLSIVLVSVILFISVISESGRVNAVQTKSKSYTYMAAESVLAGYGKQIYKDYGVLLVWENEPVEEQLKKYIQDNINMADLKRKGTNFMNTDLVNIDINKQKYVTDEEGKLFTEQVISYMKYAGTINAADNLIKKLKGYNKNSEAEMPDNGDVTDIVDNNSDELKNLADDINNIVADLKETQKLKEKIEAVSQKLEILNKNINSESNNKNHDKKVKNFLEEYRELITELDMKAGDVHSAISQINQYDRKKELFLKENGYTSDARDYIDDNLKILENVENKIKENEELAISDFSDIHLKNIQVVKKSVKDIETVENNLESLTVTSVTEKDKKNQSIYESASALLNDGILSLIVNDVSNISNNTISFSNLPTTLKEQKTDNSILGATKNKAIISLYAKMKFGTYLSPQKNTGLTYELEYIINGKNNDKDNLVKTIEKMVAIRNAANFAYIITDKEKMSEISAVSASAATAIGLPFLEPAIKGVLMEAWALAEAVCDVRELFQGEKVPLVKNRQSWNTTLSNLLKKDVEHYKGKKGLDYDSYLEILMMLMENHDLVYRIMDLIQINIQKRYNKEFMMSKCFQGLDITATFKTKPLFTAIPWVVNLLSENHDDYTYSIKCICDY